MLIDLESNSSYSPFVKGRITKSKSRELLLLLLMFDGDNKPLKAVHEKCGAKIHYRHSFPIIREISVLGQSHNHGDDANFDFVRQY
jgi:hypothetical protein